MLSTVKHTPPKRTRRQKNASVPWCLRRVPLPEHRCYRRHSQLCGNHPAKPIHLHEVRNASCTGGPSAFGSENAVHLQIISNEVLVVPTAANNRMHPSGWSALRQVIANLRDAVAMAQPFPDVEFVMCLVDTHAGWPVLIYGHEEQQDGADSNRAPGTGRDSFRATTPQPRPPGPFLIPIGMRAASMNHGVPATAPTPLDRARASSTAAAAAAAAAASTTTSTPSSSSARSPPARPEPPAASELGSEAPWEAPAPWEPPTAWPAVAEWQQRKAVAVWRGSNTGTPLLRLSTWATNTRGRLTALSRLFPDQLDAAISGWPQPHGGSREQAALERVVRSTKPMPFAALRGYRYLVDVDGNVQSNRFPALLRLGSLVLKSTRYRTALSAAVAAGQFPQVIDVHPSLEDLIAKIRCLQGKDAAARARAQQGSAAAARLLTYESQVGYLADLLIHYARMQTFRPKRLPRAVPAASLLLVPVQARSPRVLGETGDPGRPRTDLSLASARPVDLLREATGGRWPPVADAGPGRLQLAFVDLSTADCVLAALSVSLGLVCWLKARHAARAPVRPAVR